MIGAPHRILDRFGTVVIRDRRPLDEQDGKIERACGGDFACVASPPEFLLTITSILLSRSKAISSSTVKGPRASRYSTSGASSGGSTGSTLRTR